jgi:hypothetical protein
MARARKPQGSRDAQQRALLAQESARIMVEQGVGDIRLALRKAAARHGVHDPAALPRADEIEEALREHQRLFGHSDRDDALHARRLAAAEAMRFLQGFQPRLVGAVLEGTADRHSPVQLHLFSDDPDAVIRFLHEHDIPHRTGARNLHPQHGRSETVPLHAFAADGIDFELLVLPLDGLRQAPLGPGGERRQARASLAALQRLLQAGDEAAG